MTEHIERVEAWIESRYGPIAVAEAGGVWMAVVPTYGGGRAIGLGSSRGNALHDLRIDLSLHAPREAAVTPLAKWEEWNRIRRERSRRVDLLEFQGK